MIKVDLYIYDNDNEPRKLELFDDEKISLTRSITNYQDLGKLFAEFTQSFTIPCSDVNNSILYHWYENALQNGYDHRIRYNAYIEVDLVTLNIGTIQLDSVSFKDNKPENYKITFFGAVKQLKDLFGDDKLINLDFSDFNFGYTPSRVLESINGVVDWDVIFPMIGSERYFDYDNGSANDVTTTTGAVKWNELFPAIKIKKIIDKIQSHYGITFDSLFFQFYVVQQLFMLLKNGKKMTTKTEPVKINFTSKDTGFTAVDLSTDTINLKRYQSWTNSVTGHTFTQGLLTGLVINIVPSVPGVAYDLITYKNGVPIGSATGLTGTQFVDLNAYTNYIDADNFIQLYISSESPISFSTGLYITFQNIYLNPYTGALTLEDQIKHAYSSTQSTTANLHVNDYLPDMKVYDFFVGLIKMFNLVVIPTSQNNFKVMPFEMFYNSGSIHDLTNYLITDFDIKKPDLYKKLNFKYQKSEDVLNNNFNTNQGVARGFDYGDLAYTSNTNITTQTYDVELPFENIMFENRNGFLTATILDKNLNTYSNKPMLFYKDLFKIHGPELIKFFNGSTYDNIDDYWKICNEINFAQTTTANIYTTCFNEEISPYYLTTASYGLFNNYYSNFIQNLYDKRCRVISAKFILSSVKMHDIKLNDIIILKDKKYRINSITADITSGEVSMELITDFRDLSGNGITERIANFENATLSNESATFEIMIYKLWFDSFSINGSLNDILIYDTSRDNTDSVILSISIPANTSGDILNDAIPIQYKLGETTITKFITITQNA